jgi:hypothetical protein
MKPVVLTTDQWKRIRTALKEEYPPSVFLLRERMKAKLGFTIREHSSWNNGEHEFQIHLDFFSEKKQTMFLLKFSELIGNNNGKL